MGLIFQEPKKRKKQSKKQKIVTISVKGGVVTSVRNLPKGYYYKIKDYDI